ncbi:uncharacterized protein VTP21DRAFT_9729 [Calcarisporiella thermophila]|uniref:uncharacterized protein n=1 Tax=Calcarisporiella thermophila TaxID=911321 RepID=UPI00374206C4
MNFRFQYWFIIIIKKEKKKMHVQWKYSVIIMVNPLMKYCVEMPTFFEIIIIKSEIEAEKREYLQRISWACV